MLKKRIKENLRKFYIKGEPSTTTVFKFENLKLNFDL